MSEEELELDVNEPKSNGKKTIIIVVVAILLLNVIGVGAWLFLSGGDDEASTTAEKNEPVLEPLIYLTMVPEFIVNFGPASKVRYLQVDLQISTRQESSLETVNTYRPVIRNDILVILSDVKYDDLKDRAGKEALQKKLLNTINKVVTEAERPAPSGEKQDAEHGMKDEHATEEDASEDVKGPIENVFYTSFIMQ